MNTPNVIFSAVKGAGLLPLTWPDGPEAKESGPEAPPVSPSVLEEPGKAVLMSGTCGPLSSGTSRSASLQQFLESRLRRQFPSDGLMGLPVIWRQKTTLSLRAYCEQTVLERRTAAKGSIGRLLPTPTAREGRDWSRAEVLARLDNGTGVAKRICNLLPGLRSSVEIVGLNPCFAGWMMGYSAAWNACIFTAMQSFPPLRRASSVPALKPLPT